MPRKKKTASALPNALQGYEKHPVYGLLDYYESMAKAILNDRGAPIDLDSLMAIDAPARNIEKYIAVLWQAERVRDYTRANDAEAAALFMHRLAVAVNKAKLSLSGEHRQGFRKHPWLGAAITEAMTKRPGRSRAGLWNYFKVSHNGPDNSLSVDGPDFSGEVYWDDEDEHGRLFYNNGNKTVSVSLATFEKQVSQLRK